MKTLLFIFILLTSQWVSATDYKLLQTCSVKNECQKNGNEKVCLRKVTIEEFVKELDIDGRIHQFPHVVIILDKKIFGHASSYIEIPLKLKNDCVKTATELCMKNNYGRNGYEIAMLPGEDLWHGIATLENLDFDIVCEKIPN
jgi:hypothetical protein